MAHVSTRSLKVKCIRVCMEGPSAITAEVWRTRISRQHSTRDEVDVEAGVVVSSPRTSTSVTAHEPPAGFRLHSAVRLAYERGHGGMIFCMEGAATEAAFGREVLRDVEDREVVRDEQKTQPRGRARRPSSEASTSTVTKRDQGPALLLYRDAPHASAKGLDHPCLADLTQTKGVETVTAVAEAHVELLNFLVGARVVENLQVPHVASNVEGAPGIGSQGSFADEGQRA